MLSVTLCPGAAQDGTYPKPSGIMKNLPQLLVHLGTLNVTLRIHGDALSYSSPTNVLQHDTLSDLRRNRDELRRLIKDPLHLLDGPNKLHYAAMAHFNERMGVAVDQGMTTALGGPAWLTALGEALAVKPDPLDDPERASTVAALVASKPKPKHDYRKGWKR